VFGKERVPSFHFAIDDRDRSVQGVGLKTELIPLRMPFGLLVATVTMTHRMQISVGTPDAPCKIAGK
jgi:hypothetical protein